MTYDKALPKSQACVSEREYCVLENCHDPATASSWQQVGFSTKSKFTVPGLTSGTKYWFRVAAIGTAGQAPWSDPATAMAS